MRMLRWVMLAAMVPGALPILSQTPAEDAGTLSAPQSTEAGVLCTNSFRSAIYLIDSGQLRELIHGPGVGYHVAVSPNRRDVGIKVIDDRGMQTPGVIDLFTGIFRPLHDPAKRVGQVSYTNNGLMAFTIGTELLITDGIAIRKIDLGYYSNQAPVSPDAVSVAYNDADDQIHVRDLHSQLDITVTSGPGGYFNPQWSPDARKLLLSGLDGQMYVYDTVTRKHFALGAGDRPSWSPDSRTIVFGRVVIEGTRVINADLFTVGYAGGIPRALTQTDDLCEMEPQFTPDGGVLYHTFDRRDIRTISPSPDGILASRLIAAIPPSFVFRPAAPAEIAAPEIQLDIPYVHQLYDTPDWFNGNSACAPTQAIMVLAYYGMLPQWNITCSEPSPHVTPWGNYVADKYRFRLWEFSAQAASGSTLGAGGYGYMWGSGSPHTRMADYYRAHGMTATQTEGTPHSVALAEISAGYPFSMCVLLTTAGHLVLAHGLGEEPHTLVFNDPYGDKNRGYTNYYGKDVRYDWPGYNNGYQNLNEVAWCIATRATSPVPADTLVDDLQFGCGFVMRNSAPASMWLYKDMLRGINGHMWYAYTKAGSVDTCLVTWTPNLSQDGMYEVLAYIPLSNATAAPYVVTYAGGSQKVLINQKSYGNAWASLGTYPFTATGGASVVLGDAGLNAGQEIVFDAVRWSYRGPLTRIATGEVPPVGFRLDQNSPNPFNPMTTITYTVPEKSFVTLEVCNLLGERISLLAASTKSAGRHHSDWNAAGLPSGVYLCRLKAERVDGGERFLATRKMILMK